MCQRAPPRAWEHSPQDAQGNRNTKAHCQAPARLSGRLLAPRGWAPADPQAVVEGVGGGSTLVAHNACIVPKVPGFLTSPYSVSGSSPDAALLEGREPFATQT
eukprot:2796327-Pyramimonas_sp.AAC.1